MAKKNSNEQGEPVLWRHHYAGVLLGYLSESSRPGHMWLDGVRIWSWSGTRTDCASCARQGPKQGDRITAYVGRDVNLDGSVEIYPTDPQHIARGIELAEPE